MASGDNCSNCRHCGIDLKSSTGYYCELLHKNVSPSNHCSQHEER